MKKNRIYRMAIVALEDDCYDLQEELTNDQIATCAMNIVARLNYLGGVKQQTVHADLGNLAVKVHNNPKGSFVSVSSPFGTGVSRNLVDIFKIYRPATQEEVTEFIEMLNEAWYVCDK